MTRLLALNPNTSDAVTQVYVDAARAIAPDGVVIDGVTGRFGARVVSTEAEDIVAGHAALELVAEHAKDYDGIILAISFDTALGAVRSLLNAPVVGITEAALEAAEAGGHRVGAIIFGAVSQPLYRAVLARTAKRPVDVEVLEIASADDYLDPGAKDDLVLAAAERLVHRGAERVVICGTAIVGLAARLSPHAPVPLVDGIEAVPAVLNAIAAGLHSRERLSAISDNIGLTPALSALLAGRSAP